jgi:hypothetical protein
MAIVILVISVNGFCRSATGVEHMDAVKNAGEMTCKSAIEKQCPSSPINKTALPDNCNSFCYCSCHAPFTVQSEQLGYSPQIARLAFSEPFKAIPEVYISKFIPPQIFA